MYGQFDLPPGIQRKLDDLAIEQHQVTNWKSEFWEIRNAKNMGIQEALDSLPTTGGVVYVPSGTYTISETIYMKDNQTLTGAGASSIITTNVDNLDLIRCCDVSDNEKDSVVISDLQLKGKATNPHSGILLHNSHNTIIQRTFIMGLKYGIELTAVTADGDNTDNNFILDNCIGFFTSCGIYFHPDTASRGEDNLIRGNLLQHNATAGSRNGIYILKGRKNRILGNQLERVDGHSIYLRGGMLNIVNGNVITGATQHGILIYDEDYDVITNNVSCWSDFNESATYNGINITADTNKSIIANNACYLNGKYGIHIDNANCDRNIILGNVAYSNVTGQIQDDGTNTINEHNQVA